LRLAILFEMTSTLSCCASMPVAAMSIERMRLSLGVVVGG
jgi:hypothetical protein